MHVANPNTCINVIRNTGAAANASCCALFYASLARQYKPAVRIILFRLAHRLHKTFLGRKVQRPATFLPFWLRAALLRKGRFFYASIPHMQETHVDGNLSVRRKGQCLAVAETIGRSTETRTETQPVVVANSTGEAFCCGKFERQ